MINKREIAISFISLILGVILTFVLLQNNIAGLKKQISLSQTAMPTESNSLNPTLKAEMDLVKQKGYAVFDSPAYPPLGPFNVLIGVCRGSNDDYCHLAFFFYKGKYVGTDTRDPSIDVSLEWADGNTIALEYTLYHKNDPLSSPTAGATTVRFQWDGTKLKVLDPIPTSDWSVDFHR